MKRRREQGRCDAVMQHRLVWQAAAMLLVRPDDGHVARLEAVEKMLGHLDGGYAMALGRAGAGLRRFGPAAAVGHHTLAFSSGENLRLLLTHWMATDNRDRVLHRQTFVDAYRVAGVPMPPGVLPDHLAAVLEFAAHVDPDAGRQLLADHRAPLEALRRALSAEDSPYEHVIVAVCATLPEDDADAPLPVPKVTPSTENVDLQPVRSDLPRNVN